jgi:hypothetical protein
LVLEGHGTQYPTKFCIARQIKDDLIGDARFSRLVSRFSSFVSSNLGLNFKKLKKLLTLKKSRENFFKHRASSIEHRASSIEHRASSIEHRASSIEKIEPFTEALY